jgi:uncharacterized CHY-type Zn-finger protein
MQRACPEVDEINLNAQTRCAHERTALDVIEIKMKCCGFYYSGQANFTNRRESEFMQ